MLEVFDLVPKVILYSLSSAVNVILPAFLALASRCLDLYTSTKSNSDFPGDSATDCRWYLKRGGTWGR